MPITPPLNIEKFRNALRRRGLSQAALAREIGVTQAAIAKLATGQSVGSKHLHRIAAILETTPAYLTDETDDPDLGAQPRPTPAILSEQLGIVQIAKIDLELGLGATFIDGPAGVEMVSVSESWLSTMTKALPKHVFMAECRGNSMQPTINDGDWIIGNFNKTTPRNLDEIWAITHYGLGGIKRLRPFADGYKILSDNPNVSDDIATDGELSIIGRVEAIMRRV